MKEVFIVNSENGTRVVSRGVLEKDIIAGIKATDDLGLKVKQTAIASYTAMAMKDHAGKALSDSEYKEIIGDAVEGLIAYMTTSPYEFAKLIKNSKQ